MLYPVLQEKIAKVTKYIYILVYEYTCREQALTEVTSIRVSKNTLEILEKLRNKLKARSLDETLRTLIMRQRKMMINETFGLDKDRIKPFSEEDRGEDRS